MHTILLALVLALQGTTGHSIILSWVASTSAAMCLPTSTPACTLTYTVIEGTTPGGENPTPINTSPITTASYTIPVTMTSAPQTFYFKVTAVETTGSLVQVATDPTEVSVTFPAQLQAPTGLVVSGVN